MNDTFELEIAILFLLDVKFFKMYAFTLFQFALVPLSAIGAVAQIDKYPYTLREVGARNTVVS